MKFRLSLLSFSIGILNLISYGQSPNQPVNPVPANQSMVSMNKVDLCATVSDPNGGTLQVKYSGRTKSSSGSQKFTIVFLPDTQYYTEEPQGKNGGNNAMFKAQTAWIAANRESKNIVYVGQLGDCVQNGDEPPGTDKEIEWKRADTAISTIEDPVQTSLPQGIPFGICVGNHEQTPFTDPAGTTIYYNQYFGSSHFANRDYYGGHYGSNNDNHYQLFSVSGIDFMVISLEFDQTATFDDPGGPLDWAESLVQNNPDRKVIVMTHWVIDEGANFGPQGQAIYNRLRVYPNFSFFMGGHMSSPTGGEARRTDVFNGNRVHSILSDYQARPGGGNGLLRIYEFDPSQNKVSVQTCSPYTNTFEIDASSQFELPFNMLPELGQINNVASATNPCYSWTDLLYSSDYEWNMQLYDGQNMTTGPVWSFTTPTSPLPVTLLDFFAGIENGKIKLSWTTTSELDNNRFEIERSADGRNYSKIGEIPGHGNSNNLQKYVFYDEQPFAGKIFYRLKQIDISKHYSYSNSRIVLFEDSRKLVVYPNPVPGSGTLTIYLASAIRRQVKVVIQDMTGRQLFTTTKNITQNYFQIKPGLVPGVYILNMVGENVYVTEKIMVAGQ